MNFLNLSKKRQSCRKYSDAPVPKEVLERCVEAARLAPSACNSQPWRFIVVAETELKNKLADAAFSGVHTMNSFAKNAPVLVAVVTERSKYAAQLAGHFRGTQYSLIDLGIAGEHFCLQAAEEGLGTCWLGWFNQRGVKKVLGLSRKDQIDIMFSVGYPQGDGLREKIRKDVVEISEFR
ncbi:MAG: nitroreductase family protein [Candidatus Omnitrophica bacterium]|nr:nitroreductase family protein [Candidatus Omnitrophota bacterium]